MHLALSLSILVGFWGSYIIARALYRAFLHPLAKFPGPKIAAITTWYEGYYDVFLRGQFTFHLEKLHKQYGPIVRIGPNELHILDSTYYNTLYSSKYKPDKYDYFYGMLGNPGAVFATIRHDVHKARRASLAPFLSTQAITRFYPTIQRYTDRLCERMKESMMDKNEAVPLFFAYRCLTVDIISEYVYGEDLNLLERKDWGRDFYSAWRGLWEVSPLIRQFPWMLAALMALPRWMTTILNPGALEAIDMQVDCANLAKKVLDGRGKKPAVTGSGEDSAAQPVLLWELAQDGDLPPSEKQFVRLAHEAANALAAGFETTGGTLAHMTYLILADKRVHTRLLKELEAAIPDSDVIPNYQVLERLPYLWAVVKESLRLAVGAYSRLPRVNYKESMTYKDWVIPPGSAVGMSALYVALDPTIFRDPQTFHPERWLEPGARERLEPYLMTFGKGSRMCIGQNLAYAELYSVIATIFRRFPNLELYETSARDVEVVHDYFAGMWRFEKGKPGLQVRLAQ